MDEALPAPRLEQPVSKPATATLSLIARYILGKGLGLGISLCVGVYLTILVLNLGGYVDEMVRGMILESVMGSLQGGWLSDVPPHERNVIVEQTIREMEIARGLDQPFWLRSLYQLRDTLTLNIGGESVRGTVRAALPYTVALVGVSNLVVFILSIWLSLRLAHKPGGIIDRLVTGLSPLTFAPAWVHGVILITVFAGWLMVLPWPGMTLGVRPTIIPWEARLLEGWQAIQPLILPAAALFLSAFFQGVYAWRSFFLSFAQEDSVDLAKAKGLPPAFIQRRYILRPVLPYVLTNFAVLAIAFWQEAMPLEVLFGWPGIGRLFVFAIRVQNVSLMLGIIIVFAYALAITVFILDILYALIDPRVHVGAQQGSIQARLAKMRSAGRQKGFVTALLHRWRGRSPRSKPTHRGWTPVVGEAPAAPAPSTAAHFPRLIRALRERGSALLSFMRQFMRYPAGVAGLAVILVMVGVAGYTLIKVPYEQATLFWRGQGGEEFKSYWYKNPTSAPPAWTNLFRTDKQPPTIILDSRNLGDQVTTETITEAMSKTVLPLSFAYSYDGFPKEIRLYFEPHYQKTPPLISLLWITPDGRELDLTSFTIRPRTIFYLSTDEKLARRFGTTDIPAVLFADPQDEAGGALRGTYELQVQIFSFEPDTTVDLEAIFYGQVHGLVGTDPNRKDPMLALMWGTVFALAFGLAGAVGTSLAAVFLAAMGVWYGGWVDGLIQRLTEINLILPKLAIAILVYILYSKSIWAILGVLVLLNVFGSAVKSYRAFFLQAIQAPYIEAARAYGTKSGRMIRSYLLPGILPVLIPQMVMLIPGYVFYEATLAYMGVSDPYLPTWGKVIYEGLARDALLHGLWYQVLIPIGLLALTGLAFALVGNTLEAILNPHMKDVSAAAKPPAAVGEPAHSV